MQLLLVWFVQMSFKYRLNFRAQDDASEKLFFSLITWNPSSFRKEVSDGYPGSSHFIDRYVRLDQHSPFSTFLSCTCELRRRGGRWRRRSAPSIAYAEGGHVRDRGHVVNFAKYQPKSGYTRLHWPLHLALSNCQPMGITIAVVHHRPRAWHAGETWKEIDKRGLQRSRGCTGCSTGYSVQLPIFLADFSSQQRVSKYK